MKEFNLWLIAIASLFLLASSCTKEESRTSDYSLKNPAQLIDQFNAGKLEINRGDYLKGNVYLRSASEDRLAVYLLSPSQQQTVYYILQSNGLSNPRFESSIKNAEVLFFRQSLIINAVNKNERYLIRLTKAENFVPVTEYTKIFSGFGLSRNLGDPFPDAVERGSGFGNPGDPPVQEVSCECVPDSSPNAPCDAGGTGSSECSASSGGQACSVSCDEDNYSCCNY